MPLPVEKLHKGSSKEEVRRAVSESIEQCVREGERSQDECVAMAHEMARKRVRSDIRRGLEEG